MARRVTFLSIPLGHLFRRYPLPKKMEEMQIALEHLTVIGGPMCATALIAVQHDPARSGTGSAVVEMRR